MNFLVTYLVQVASLFERGYLKNRIDELQESLKSFLAGKKTSAALTAQLSNATKSVGSLFERGQRSVSPTVSNLQVKKRYNLPFSTSIRLLSSL